MRKWIAPLWLFLLSGLLFFACDNTEGEGGGGIQPSASDPEIIEGFMCNVVQDGKPVGIGNDFIQDDVISVWLSWVNVTGKHEVKVIWIDPTDDVIEQRESFDSKNGKWTSYFWIDTTSSAHLGRWTVEVFIDGEFVRSYDFWIFEK